MSNVRPVSYMLSSGETKTANEIPVVFPTEKLNEEELAVIGALSDAVSGITPIFVQQQNNRGLEFFEALFDYEQTLSGADEQALMNDYLTVVSAANAPWNMFRETIMFPFQPESIPADSPLHEFRDFLWGDFVVPEGRSLYPADMTDEEYGTLGDQAQIENSTIIRNPSGELEVILNEERFKEELEPILDALHRARSLTSDSDLGKHIDAKITEMETGAAEDRNESWGAWIQSNSKIGFVLGTGIELYLDGEKGVRGAAQGILYIVNEDYQSLADTMAALLPQMEKDAPWQVKQDIDPDQLPNLQFVNVVNSSGFYNLFPNNVVAESLPDDEEIVKQYGSVNLVFTNVQEAIAEAGETNYIINEFFITESVTPYRELMFKTNMTMTAAHELGHRTGTIKDDDAKTNFGEHYSILEEARAEAFSMWALPYLVNEGIITENEEIAGYFSMLTAMVKALPDVPQNHSGARNLLFHYFLDRNAVTEAEGRYDIDVPEMRLAVEDLLGLLGDIRAEGDLEGLQQLKKQYIRPDQQERYKERLSGFPRGRGFIFPVLEGTTGNVTYPDSFREQERTIEHFV